MQIAICPCCGKPIRPKAVTPFSSGPLLWAHGQGFPKSTAIDKAIDKARNDDIYHVTAFVADARDAAGITNADIDDAFAFHGMAGHWTSQKSQPAIPTWDQWQQLKKLLGFSDEMDAEVWRLNGRKGQPGDAWHEREVVGRSENQCGVGWAEQGMAGYKPEFDITAPATDAAKLWEGWGTALKPAYEPIIIAMKPRDSTFANNALVHGVAGLWIDGVWVGTNGRPHRVAYGQNKDNNASEFKMGSGNAAGETQLGRWPPNIILSHTDQCVRTVVSTPCQTCDGTGKVVSEPFTMSWEEWYSKAKDSGGTRREWEQLSKGPFLKPCPDCDGQGQVRRMGTKRVKGAAGGQHGTAHGTQIWGNTGDARTHRQATDPDGYEEVESWICSPSCPVRLVGEDSGERVSCGHYNRGSKMHGPKLGPASIPIDGDLGATYNDHGTASRFFPNLEPDACTAEDFTRFDPGAIACHSAEAQQSMADENGRETFSAIAPDNHTLRFKYQPKAPKREKWLYCAICDDAYPVSQVEDHAHGKPERKRDHIERHPTQKPLSLMIWLAKLTRTPTGGVVLDPFMGTGSTGEACINTGRDFIGIDQERPSYITAKRRLEWAEEQAREPEQLALLEI